MIIIMLMGSKYKKIKIKAVGQRKVLNRLLHFLIAIFLFIEQPLLLINTANAQNFDPNNIISDQFLFASGRLSVAAIQNFLQRQNSVLSRYSEVINGHAKSAAQVVHDAASKWNVAEEFLLATLEKEQGLLTSSQVPEKRLDWAMGYGCFDGQCKDKYKGFANQVDAAAETQQIYRQKTFAFGVQKTTKTHDNYTVTPKNQATANLYIYTPYLGYSPEHGVQSRYGGVKLFWRIISQYFPEKKYPDGLLVTDGTNFWKIQNGEKRKFYSREIFLSDYAESDAIHSNSEDLSEYPEGQPIYFAENTLVRSQATNQTFLIEGNKKRFVTDNVSLSLINTFHVAVNSLEEIPKVPHDQLLAYEDGEPIRPESKHPQGKLFHDPAGKIYLLKDGMKHDVHPEISKINFPGKTPDPIDESELSEFLSLSPIKIKDGTFLKNSKGDFYIISGEKRSKIHPEVMQRVFGSQKMQSAVVVSDEALNVHEAGVNIEYIDDTIIDPPITQTSTIQPTTGIFKAEFQRMNPDSIILLTNEKKEVLVTLKNTGNVEWKENSVWVEVNTTLGRFYPIEKSVLPNQSGVFPVTLSASSEVGVNSQRFALYREVNGKPEKILSFGKFVLVKKGSSAQLMNHTLPSSVKNSQKPVKIEMVFKNTSNETWYSPKTALKIYNEHGQQSSFYDKADWVKPDVAAVPLNNKNIKPNENAHFYFTLDPRNIKAGIQTLSMEIIRLDAPADKQQVFVYGTDKMNFQIGVED